jgi:hypothetical protein
LFILQSELYRFCNALKNFIDGDIAELLTEENNSDDDVWSEDENEEVIESEHEDESDYEGEKGEGKGCSSGHDDSVSPEL